jgi:hypothetical protein
MIGISILVVLGIYLWIAVATTRFIFKITSSQAARLISAMAFLLIPTWDSIWGTVQLRYLCAAEGGSRAF